MVQRRSLHVVSVLAIVAVVGMWFLAAAMNLVSPLFLPGPGEVLITGYELLFDGYRNVSLVEHVMVSIGRAFFAFALAALIGIPTGIAMGMSALLHAVLNPFVQFLRPLPKLALIPLVIVWFGIGEFSKILLIFLATFLTVTVASAAAVLTVPEGRIRAALSLGANRWQLFRHVILPSALPELFTGVRVGIGIGFTTLVAAEMIASTSGLGWMVMNASHYLRTDIVMLGIVILGVTGYLLDISIVSAQRRWVHWMGKN